MNLEKLQNFSYNIAFDFPEYFERSAIVLTCMTKL